MALAESDFDAVVTTLMPKMLSPARLEDPRLQELMRSMARAVGVEGFKRQEIAIIERIDSRPHLKDIRSPRW